MLPVPWYDLSHAEHRSGDRVTTGGAHATGTVGIRTRNASTSGTALPDYLESGGGSAECGQRLEARREPTHRAAVAQAGAPAGHQGGLGDRSRSRAQSDI